MGIWAIRVPSKEHLNSKATADWHRQCLSELSSYSGTDSPWPILVALIVFVIMLVPFMFHWSEPGPAQQNSFNQEPLQQQQQNSFNRGSVLQQQNSFNRAPFPQQQISHPRVYVRQ